jgi:glycosyltransferase involved in cell wall biosynthesis
MYTEMKVLDKNEVIEGLVSIVIVSHNRKELLNQCLQSCFTQEYPLLEVIIIDNASRDGTAAMVKSLYPKAKLLSMHDNLGFFPVLNMAIANSSGEYIMTVDDDAYFINNNVIDDLVYCFHTDASLGAATCNLVGPKETPIDKGDRFIDVFTTGFTMVPRKVFSEWVGYYPDVFFRSAGETYICTALWDMNKTVKRFQDIKMYHELAAKGRSDSDWKFYGLRSQLLCVVMREPLILVLPLLISKGIKSFFLFIKWGHFFTWFRVWGSFVIHLGDAFKRRNPISMKTWKLMKKLRSGYFTNINNLPV